MSTHSGTNRLNRFIFTGVSWIFKIIIINVTDLRKTVFGCGTVKYEPKKSQTMCARLDGWSYINNEIYIKKKKKNYTLRE